MRRGPNNLSLTKYRMAKMGMLMYEETNVSLSQLRSRSQLW